MGDLRSIRSSSSSSSGSSSRSKWILFVTSMRNWIRSVASNVTPVRAKSGKESSSATGMQVVQGLDLWRWTLFFLMVPGPWNRSKLVSSYTIVG